jgi:hypothetical protein
VAFNGAYTAVQQVNDSDILFTDVSTGSDTNLTERRIYPYKADGTLLLPTGNTTGYIVWPIASSTLAVTLLPKDYALSITVVWISSNPLSSPSTYTQTTLYGFTGYTSDFLYSLIQQITANQTLLNDNQFQTNMFYLGQEITNCNLSVSPKLSILNAQAALSRAQYLITNANKFF